MLRRIQVSGFKSLFGFELEFRPGLNVLVGPNGSGKTNIINFIEFLSFLTREPLLDAVGRSGGAGRIFRRNATGTLTKQIWFCASGDGNIDSFRQGSPDWTAYELSANIELSENDSALYYRQQRIKLNFDKDRVSTKDWHFDIEVSSKGEDDITVHIHELVESYIHSLFFPALSKKEEVAATIRQFFSEHGRSRAIHQLFRSVFGIPSILWSDFTGAQSYNISPATVRLPEDIASEPKISQNGSGLAATLFALKNARVRDERQPHLEKRFKEPKSTLGKIISYSRIVDKSTSWFIVSSQCRQPGESTAARPAAICRRLQPISSAAACSFLVSTETPAGRGGILKGERPTDLPVPPG
jgi:AAA ATPase domain